MSLDINNTGAQLRFNFWKVAKFNDITYVIQFMTNFTKVICFHCFQAMSEEVSKKVCFNKS